MMDFTVSNAILVPRGARFPESTTVIISYVLRIVITRRERSTQEEFDYGGYSETTRVQHRKVSLKSPI
jgi:hypothetical protein